MSADGTCRQVGTAWRCEREQKTQGVVEDSLSKGEPMPSLKSNVDVSLKSTSVSDANLESPYITENASEEIQPHDDNGPALVGVSSSGSEFVGAGGANLTTAAPVTLQQQQDPRPDVNNTCSIQGVDLHNTNVTPTPPILSAWPVGPRKSVSVEGSDFVPVTSAPRIQGYSRVSSYDQDFENVGNVNATSASAASLYTSVPQLGVAPLNREEFTNPKDVQPSVTKSTHFLQRQASGTQPGQTLAALVTPKGWKAAQQYRSLSTSVRAFRRFSMPPVYSTSDGGASDGASTTDPGNSS